MKKIGIALTLLVAFASCKKPLVQVPEEEKLAQDISHQVSLQN